MFLLLAHHTSLHNEQVNLATLLFISLFALIIAVVVALVRSNE